MRRGLVKSKVSGAGGIIPLDNLKAYYKFEGNANDSVGAINGSAIGVTYPDEITGKVIKFQGINGSRLQLGDNDLFSFADGAGDVPRSISFMAKLTTLSNQYFISKDAVGGREWQLRYVANIIRFNLIDQVGGIKLITVNSNSYTTLEEWFHIIISKNEVNDETGIDIYINGINQTNSRAGNAEYVQTRNTGSAVWAGNQTTFDTAQMFSGYMDALGFWDIKISAEQALAIANKNLNGEHLI